MNRYYNSSPGKRRCEGIQRVVNLARSGASTHSRSSSPVGIFRYRTSADAVYLNYSFNEKISIFARYDVNNQNTDNNISTSKTLFGLVFNPTRGLYIAPNIIIQDIINDEAIEEYHLTCMFKY